MRLFIAIPVSVKDYLSKIEVPGRKVTDYHLTLKFLGDIDKPEKIIRKLKLIRFSPFELVLGEIGYFPNRRRPKVIWVGVKPQEPVIELHRQIESLLGKDKKFHPHITLSRLKRSADIPEIEIEKRKIIVDSLELIKSTLLPSGPVYETLFRFCSLFD